MDSIFGVAEAKHVLTTANRITRALIGVAALAVVLLNPRLHEIALFVLTMIGFYGSLTAFLGIGFIRSLFGDDDGAGAGSDSAVRPLDARTFTADQQRIYKKVA